MTTEREPDGLRAGGLELWRGVTEVHDLDVTQRAQLVEACRAKDRLDQLDGLLRGDIDVWATVYTSDAGADLVIDRALDKANTTANLMKQLLAALRLPDEVSGKRPQFRGPRGAQAPTVPGGKVSSLDRARAAKSS
jgi:hypothetical protein